MTDKARGETECHSLSNVIMYCVTKVSGLNRQATSKQLITKVCSLSSTTIGSKIISDTKLLTKK